MASRTPPSEALAAWLPRQRWFASKTLRIEAIAVEASIPVGEAALTILAVRLGDGSAERYAVALRPGPEPADALADAAFAERLLDLMAAGGSVAGEGGAIHAHRRPAFPERRPAGTVRPLGGEQSNTSIAVGDALIIKLFRRVADGVNPEQEITRFLTERTSFANTPRLAGDLEYRSRGGAIATLAVAQELVPGARDGWQWALAQLQGLREAARRGPAAAVREVSTPMLAALRRLGQRTGELHRALASDAGDPDFAPEPITAADLRLWAARVASQAERARTCLGGRLPATVPHVGAALAGLAGLAKIRHHGDFHLGQTLYVEDRADFSIIDFEGEPLRPLPERRQKHAAVRDVAGMRRSLAYAAASAARDGDEAWLGGWETEARRAFTGGYRDATRGAPFVPAGDEDFERAVAVFELEKAAYEIVYEANNRPDWIAIPTRGLVSAAATLARRESSGAA